MIKSSFSVVGLVYISLFTSCSHKEPSVNISVYRTLSRSLSQSSNEIRSQISVLQKKLENDTLNQNTSFYAKEWLPKAQLIQVISNEMLDYIDNQKRDLKIEAGLKLVNMREEWEEDNFKAVENIFKIKGKGDELRQRISEYESKVLAVDSGINSLFKNSVSAIIPLIDFREHEQKNFTETFFGNVPVAGAFAVLEKFENDIRNLEIQLMHYCYLQIPR